jgi:uncharacterized protein YukE
MRIKVRYNDLKSTCTNISKKTSDLAVQIDNLSKIVEELHSIWKGVDGEAFYSSTIQYVQQAKVIPEKYNYLNGEIIKLNEKYEEIQNMITIMCLDESTPTAYTDGLNPIDPAVLEEAHYFDSSNFGKDEMYLTSEVVTDEYNSIK